MYLYLGMALIDWKLLSLIDKRIDTTRILPMISATRKKPEGSIFKTESLKDDCIFSFLTTTSCFETQGQGMCELCNYVAMRGLASPGYAQKNLS